MPVLGIDHERAGCCCPDDLPVDRPNEILTSGDVEASVDVGEVILHVDDDQRRLLVIADHLQSIRVQFAGC